MTKRLSNFALLFVLMSSFAVSQCAPAAGKETTKPQDAAAPSSDAAKPASDETKPQDTKPQEAPAQEPSKPNKKDKKKKDKKSQQDDLTATAFSEAAAQDVLGTLRDGLEGHSQRLMLSAFDDNKMDGYLAFEDQIQAFFNKYEGFTVHFRISQSTTEGGKGVVLADIQMEELPRGGAAPPVRKQTEMRFELERGRKGWKIVDFRPRGFFS